MPWCLHVKLCKSFRTCKDGGGSSLFVQFIVSNKLCLLSWAWFAQGLRWWGNCIYSLENHKNELVNCPSEFHPWIFRTVTFAHTGPQPGQSWDSLVSKLLNFIILDQHFSKDVWKKWCLAVCTDSDGKIV